MHPIQHYAPAALTTVDPAAYQTRLNEAERAAVRLAQTDDLRSVVIDDRENWLQRLVRGAARPNRLADPRLEGLRRFAVAIAHEQRLLAEWERTELIGIGYTHVQLDEAAEIASAFRRTASRRPARTPTLFAEIRGDLIALGAAFAAAIALLTATATAAPYWLADLPPTVALGQAKATPNN